MSSYRRYVAKHGAATARAKRQIRRHGLETGPLKQGPVNDPDRIVAYRSTIARSQYLLRCLEHLLPEGPAAFPVTSDDLPDGGLCTFLGCGRDVLAVADIEPRPWPTPP